MNHFNKKDFIKDSLIIFLFCLALYVFFGNTNGQWYTFQLLWIGFILFVLLFGFLGSIFLYFLHRWNTKLSPCLLISVFSGFLFLRFFKSSVLFSLGLYGFFYWITVAIIIGLLFLFSVLIGYKFQRKVNPFIIIFLFSVLGTNFIPFSKIVSKKYELLKKSKNIESDFYQIYKKDANFQIRPNIYHIVLDTYMSNKTLKEVYKIDNSKFYKELRKRGFKVYENAYSNGADTRKTMVAIFDMKFFNPNRDSFSFYGKNRAWGVLFAGGYQAFCVYPCISHSESPGKIIDKISFPYEQIYFLNKINVLIQNYLGFFFGFSSFNLAKNYSLSVQYYISKKTMENRSPTLFYYHNLTFSNNTEGGLKHVNFQTLEILDDILQNDPEAIIILHSDHGSREGYMLKRKAHSDTPEENFGILQAVKFPKECERFNQLERLSPINYYQYIHSCLRGEEQPRHLEPANSYMLGTSMKDYWANRKNKSWYMFIENGKILEKPVKINKKF